MVKLWDIRMLAELMSIETGKYPANKCAFDASGEVRLSHAVHADIVMYSFLSHSKFSWSRGHIRAAMLSFGPVSKITLRHY